MNETNAIVGIVLIFLVLAILLGGLAWIRFSSAKEWQSTSKKKRVPPLIAPSPVYPKQIPQIVRSVEENGKKKPNPPSSVTVRPLSPPPANASPPEQENTQEEAPGYADEEQAVRGYPTDIKNPNMYEETNQKTDDGDSKHPEEDDTQKPRAEQQKKSKKKRQNN